MLGDRDLNLLRERYSDPRLVDLLAEAARNTGHSDAIFKTEGYEEDDHLPFKQRGVPVLDMIDVDYGPRTRDMPDGYHHTAEDTLDKLSARSLQTSADLLLELLRLLEERY